MNPSRLLPLMIYLWILAAFIINYSTAAKKKVRKNHRQKCMTYKNPAYSSEMSQNGHKRVKRLINGWEGDIRQMPWMVYVSYTYQQNGQNRSTFFTGSLISPRYVLTCGHCGRFINRMTENDTMIVVYGSANKSEGGHQIVLNKTAATVANHRHPNYTETGGPIFRDQAILDLGQEIEFDETVHSICIVCLDPNSTSNPEGNATIAGWGSTVAPCQSSQPSVWPDVFRWDIVQTHPCLSPAPTKICNEANAQHTIGGGDSGGPALMVRNNTNDGRQYQIGVLGGNTCAPRENRFEKIDGEWVEQMTGVKCKNYNED